MSMDYEFDAHSWWVTLNEGRDKIEIRSTHMIGGKISLEPSTFPGTFCFPILRVNCKQLSMKLLISKSLFMVIHETSDSHFLFSSFTFFTPHVAPVPKRRKILNLKVYRIVQRYERRILLPLWNSFELFEPSGLLPFLATEVVKHRIWNGFRII